MQGTVSPITAPDVVASTYDFEIKAKNELLLSQGNPYDKSKGTHVGSGPFLVVRREIPFDAITPVLETITGFGIAADIHRTPFSAISPGTSWPTPIITSKSELDAAGTTAISNVLPTNPLSGLLVALGELKADGFPLLPGIQTWRQRTLTAKSAGSEYLNKEFGWLPLLSDIRKTANSILNSNELIRQYERNSGRPVRRSMSFPVELSTTTTEEVGGGFNHILPFPSIIGSFIGSNGTIKSYTTESTKIQRWFEGSFTYYLPPYRPGGDNSERDAQIRNYLYGTRLTPEGLWDLTPWTWAADWVGNFGDVLHNVSAFQNDGLVMPYGYIMERSVHEVQYTLSPLERADGYSGSVSAILRTTVKQRWPATPYGFGLSLDDLSFRQLAIIVALGLVLL